MTALRLTRDGRLDGTGPVQDERLRRVLDVLNPDGEETRLVGGVVRNALLGLPPGDLDLATTLEPRTVQRLAKAARLRSIPTGIDHGTVTVLADGLPVEVTTLREDVETDGRHAVVRFGRDFCADAQRRDFTINALSLGRDGRLFDYTGGLEDLAARRVRFIGDPDTRIREDYLRILRFFRFHATYGAGSPDPAGVAAVARNRDGIARLSRERVRGEMLKLLSAPGAAEAADAMAQAGVLEPVLGRRVATERLARMVRLEPGPGDGLLRLATLALESSADADLLRKQLRLSNSETARLENAVAALGDVAPSLRPPPQHDLRRLLFRHGRDAAEDTLRLVAARDAPDDSGSLWTEALAWLARAERPVLPLSGRDITARGLRGPAVGAALAELSRAWANAGFPDDPVVLQALLDAAVGAVPTRTPADGGSKSRFDDQPTS